MYTVIFCLELFVNAVRFKDLNSAMLRLRRLAPSLPDPTSHAVTHALNDFVVFAMLSHISRVKNQ